MRFFSTFFFPPLFVDIRECAPKEIKNTKKKKKKFKKTGTESLLFGLIGTLKSQKYSKCWTLLLCPISTLELPLRTASSPATSKRVPQLVLQLVPLRVSVRVSQRVPVRVSQRVPVRVSQRVPVRVSQRVPIRVSQRVPIRVSQRVPTRYSRYSATPRVSRYSATPSTRQVPAPRLSKSRYEFRPPPLSKSRYEFRPLPALGESRHPECLSPDTSSGHPEWHYEFRQAGSWSFFRKFF